MPPYTIHYLEAVIDAVAIIPHEYPMANGKPFKTLTVYYVQEGENYRFGLEYAHIKRITDNQTGKDVTKEIIG